MSTFYEWNETTCQFDKIAQPSPQTLALFQQVQQFNKDNQSLCANKSTVRLEDGVWAKWLN